MSDTARTYLAGLIALIGIAVIISAIGLTIYGLILAFSASIILGIVTLCVEPAPLVFAIFALFGTNIPQRLVEAFPNIFPV